MSSFGEKIQINSLSIEDIDISAIEEYSNWLPKNGVSDLNIAEQGLTITLHAQNICQEQIIKVDRLISIKECARDKVWADAALVKATAAGYKTAKDREWFAMADSEVISAINDVSIAKAAKKWLENKASYFSGWHYSFKTFLKRDYDLEKLGNFNGKQYNTFDSPRHEVSRDTTEIAGEIEWQE